MRLGKGRGRAGAAGEGWGGLVPGMGLCPPSPALPTQPQHRLLASTVMALPSSSSSSSQAHFALGLHNPEMQLVLGKLGCSKHTQSCSGAGTSRFILLSTGVFERVLGGPWGVGGGSLGCQGSRWGGRLAPALPWYCLTGCDRRAGVLVPVPPLSLTGSLGLGFVTAELCAQGRGTDGCPV